MKSQKLKDKRLSHPRRLVKLTSIYSHQFDIRFEVVNSTDELMIGTVEQPAAHPVERQAIEEKRRKAAELRKQKLAEKAT